MDLFKNKYKLDPSYEQTLQTIVNFPWTPKIFYGIISDTFPICGSRKRSYLIVMGLLQATCSVLLALVEFEHALTTALIGMLIVLARAFMDVVVDGMMVQ